LKPGREFHFERHPLVYLVAVLIGESFAIFSNYYRCGRVHVRKLWQHTMPAF